MSPPNLQKYFEKCSSAFSEDFFICFQSPSTLSIPAVCRIASHFFGAIDKIDSPTLLAAAALFPCTVSQAHIPLQLSIATCLSPNGTFDVDKYPQYAASLLARARSQSAAILSTMIGDGESHTGFVGQEEMLHSFKNCMQRGVF